MVSLQPNFPGQLPLLAPDGQVVYPVHSFPTRLGFPESCSYLGSVDLPLGEVGGGDDHHGQPGQQEQVRHDGPGHGRLQQQKEEEHQPTTAQDYTHPSPGDEH